MSTWLVALVLLPIALVLVAGLVVLLARPLAVPALAALERARFQRRLAHAARGDAQQRVRLLALAKVDRLLDRRGDMQRAYLQLRNRPLRDGRRLQLERELHRNARETRAAVRELIADLQLLSGRKVAYQ